MLKMISATCSAAQPQSQFAVCKLNLELTEVVDKMGNFVAL